MKARLLGLLALASLCAFAAGGASCGGAARGGGERDKIHVGIVFDTGGKDDRSFNAAAWEGVKRAAKEFPIVLRDVEPGDPTSVEPAIRAFAEEGYDLIIGVGFEQMPVVERVAKDYPNLNFVVIDGLIKLPNVASLVFKEHQGSYLVGMLAAKKSRTGVIGFLGGMDIPLIHRFETGYREGAQSVNPNIRVVSNYVGVTADAWNNPGKGKELAVSQIERGADVIFTAAGNSGLGAFDAAEQRDKFVIGVDSNQNWVKPGHVLTSMVKRVDNAVYQMVKEKVEGGFRPGVHVFGLENDGVGYAMDQHNEPLIDPAWLQEVEAAKAKIIGGQIQVTDAMAK